jgi:23S rRNA (guanosine2251-2'-O)-methyltransferase
MIDAKFVYGKNPVKEKLKIIKDGELYLKDGINKSLVFDIINKAKSKNIKITYLNRDNFQKKFGDDNQGIVLKIYEEFINDFNEKDIIDLLKEKNDSTIILLDGIKDVGNFGAILRSALLFNADAVILPKDNSTPITEAVIKCSSGAVFQHKIAYVTNLSRFIAKLKDIGYWIYAASKSGESIVNIKFNEKRAIVFGEESKGIRELVRKNCDMTFSIPTNEKLDSLNVSVSAGIILYEIYKRSLLS